MGRTGGKGAPAARARRASLRSGQREHGKKTGGQAGTGRSVSRKSGQPFIVLTGLSGSGKSQAIRALEDLGYFCVDNLPTTLIPTLARLSVRGGGNIEKVAIVVDVRERDFLSQFPTVFQRLRKMPRLNP